MPSLPTGTPPKANPNPKPTSRTSQSTPRRDPLRTQLRSLLRASTASLKTRLTHYTTPTFRRTTGRIVLFFLSIYASGALIRSYLLDWSRNEGLSMLPTIPAAHSRSVYSPLYAHGRGLKIGDIVQASHPLFPRTMIGKRVVGMPGDYVLRDENLAPTAGGAWVEGFGDGREPGWERSEPLMVQVPEGHVWLAGDNMAWSRDSRFYGPVPLALIKAKTLWLSTGLFSWESVWKEQVSKVENPEQV